MTIGTKDLATIELDGFENSRLTDELRKAKEELFNLRFQLATGTLEGHGRLRAVKRDISRIYTVLRERELGIRATPIAAPAPVVEAKKPRAKKADAVVADAAAADVEAAPAVDETTVVVEEPVKKAPTQRSPAKKAPAKKAAAEEPAAEKIEETN